MLSDLMEASSSQKLGVLYERSALLRAACGGPAQRKRIYATGVIDELTTT